MRPGGSRSVPLIGARDRDEAGRSVFLTKSLVTEDQGPEHPVVAELFVRAVQRAKRADAISAAVELVRPGDTPEPPEPTDSSKSSERPDYDLAQASVLLKPVCGGDQGDNGRAAGYPSDRPDKRPDEREKRSPPVRHRTLRCTSPRPPNTKIIAASSVTDGNSRLPECSLGRRYLIQTARTCLKSVTPRMTFWIPSCRSVVIPSR